MCLLSRVGVCFCACVHALRVIAYAFALICCHVAIHCVFCVCALGFIVGDCLCVWLFMVQVCFTYHTCVWIACLFCFSVFVRWFVRVCCFSGDCMRLLLSFARMRFIFHVWFAFVPLVCLCVLVCLFPV